MNGWGLKASDYFTPSADLLQPTTLDLGTTGVLLVPPSVGAAAAPNLMLVASQQGTLYLLNQDDLGKYDPSGDQVVQELTGAVSRPVFSMTQCTTTAPFTWPARICSGETFSISDGVLSNGSTSIVQR